jgi:hypothetical protein
MTNAERETRLANLENQASTFTSDVPPLLLMQIKKLKIELGIIKDDGDDDSCLACGS